MSTHWEDHAVVEGFRTACGKHSMLSFHVTTRTREVTCKACWNTVSFRRALSRVGLIEDPRGKGTSHDAMDKAMQRALEEDGKKLKAMTGEDHGGPWRLGDLRCDECDNGIERAWLFCAWCGKPNPDQSR